ncbi:MAG: hypothetical protein IT285_09910 [Bdellovibrionales bacterium]|nr:hypothetical protein [Bdellovibrionales bacterium]
MRKLKIGIAVGILAFGAGVMAGVASKPASKGFAGKGVWVSRPDGSKSCESGSGRPIESDEKALRDGGIPVIEANHGDDGQMHIQMCGAETGRTHRFRIPEDALPKARTLGFEAEQIAGISQ